MVNYFQPTSKLEDSVPISMSIPFEQEHFFEHSLSPRFGGHQPREGMLS